MAIEKKNRKIIFLIFEIILVMVLLFSIYKIVSIHQGYAEGDEEYDRVSKLADMANTGDKSVDFKSLKAENPDTFGWIFVRDTVINYPIMRGQDNSFYLRHLFNKEYNTKGSVFIDYRCLNPFEDFNTIVYGHRVKDGSMFEDLVKYKKRDFYENHKKVFLATEEKEYDAEVIGVLSLKASSPLYKIDFTDEEKQDYIDDIKAKSIYDIDTEVTVQDKSVMLSTCSYEYKNARLVVFLKL